MGQDLSFQHGLVSDLFSLPTSRAEWDRFRLPEEQIRFYEEYGYVSGIRMLDERQVQRLCSELEALTDTAHPGHSLFYEFHSNESKHPATVLFHAPAATAGSFCPSQASPATWTPSRPC